MSKSAVPGSTSAENAFCRGERAFFLAVSWDEEFVFLFEHYQGAADGPVASKKRSEECRVYVDGGDCTETAGEGGVSQRVRAIISAVLG